MSETQTMLPITVFAEWLASGERGLSSEAMVQHMTGHLVGRRGGSRGDHPYDLDDFRRCELLLREVPVARLLLPTMAQVSPVWARLVARWAELVDLFETEVPGVFTMYRWHGRTPRAGPLMTELVDHKTASSGNV